jgi:hypothetical protein
MTYQYNSQRRGMNMAETTLTIVQWQEKSRGRAAKEQQVKTGTDGNEAGRRKISLSVRLFLLILKGA